MDTEWMKKADEDELRARAMAAYFRSEGSEADQPAHGGEVVEHDGREYVVLNNINGTLAVYRVTTQDQLRRLRRWPEELDAP